MKKSIVFYPFLFAIYPILFFIGHNKVLFLPFSLIFCLSVTLLNLALFFGINHFVKDRHRTGFILALLIFLFYQGSITKLALAIVVSIIVCILVIAAIYFILKQKKDLSKITYILNFVSLILILMSLFALVQSRLELNNLTMPPQDKIIENEIKAAQKSKLDTQQLPDIYYIIPDEYAGAYTLNKYYNFDNKQFIDFLAQRGFYIPEKNSSNYPATSLSLNSSLNMRYLNYKINKTIKDEICIREIYDNDVIRLLRAYGYQTTIFLNEWHLSRDINNNFKKSWDNKVDTLKDSSFVAWDNLRNRSIFRFIFWDYLSKERREYKLRSFYLLNNFVKDKKQAPQFVFFHILMPHPPCLFDENGKAKWSSPKEYITTNYVGQLKYTNTLIENTVKNIQANDKNAIIIIQPDHGHRNLANLKKDEKVRYDNFIAIYMPEKYKKKAKLYPEITPVNIFRTILNPVLNINLKRLEDKNDFRHK